MKKIIIEARGERAMNSLVNLFINQLEIKIDEINEQFKNPANYLTIIMKFYPAGGDADIFEKDNLLDTEYIKNDTIIDLGKTPFIFPMNELKAVIVAINIEHYFKMSANKNIVSSGVYTIDYDNNNNDRMYLSVDAKLSVPSGVKGVDKSLKNLFSINLEEIRTQLYNVALHELNHGLQKKDIYITRNQGLFSQDYLEEKNNTIEFIKKITKLFNLENSIYIQELINEIQTEDSEIVIQKFLNKLDAREVDAYIRSAHSIAKSKNKLNPRESQGMYLLDILIKDTKSFWESDINKKIKIGIILTYLSYAAIIFDKFRFNELDNILNGKFTIRNILKEKYGITYLVKEILNKL